MHVYTYTLRNIYMISTCFQSHGASILVQMGGRCSCGRRPAPPTVEPEPECPPVSSESSFGSHSDSGEEAVGGEEEEELPLTVPRTLRWPPGWEYVDTRYRLTLGEPPDTATVQAGYRFYAVWSIPLCPRPQLFAGVHWGFDLAGYSGILALNRGQFKGLRWRRCFTAEEVVRVYQSETVKYNLDHRPLVHYKWQQNPEL